MKAYAEILQYVPRLYEVGEPILQRYREVKSMISELEQLEVKAASMRCNVLDAVFELIDKTEKLWTLKEIQTAKEFTEKTS